jgi:hypothetical protein
VTRLVAVIAVTVAVFTVLTPTAFTADAVHLDDGLAQVEADPDTAPGDLKESDSLPFSQTATGGSANATQNTTVRDSASGLAIESHSTLSGSNSDFAYTRLVRRFTVTAPIPYRILGTLGDSLNGPGNAVQRVALSSGGVPFFEAFDADGDEYAGSGMLAPGSYEVEATGSCQPSSSGTCTAHIDMLLELGQAGCANLEIQVGFAVADGCFDETAAGSKVWETGQRAWVGGFEILPRPGGKLVVNENARTLSESGTGVDLVFAGFAVPIPLSVLPVNTPDGTFELNQPGTIEAIFLKLPVKGTATVAWADGGKSSRFTAELVPTALIPRGSAPVSPSPGVGLRGPGGKFNARLENRRGLLVEQAEVRIDELNFTPGNLRIPRAVSLRNILLRFELRGGQPFWTGQAGIRLPLTRGAMTFTGRVFVFDGRLAGIGLGVDGINQRLGGTPLFLQRLSGDIILAPKFGYELGAGGTFGPKVNGAAVMSLDGTVQGGDLVRLCPNGDDPMRFQMVAKLVPLTEAELNGIADVDITGRTCLYTGDVDAIEATLIGKVSFGNGAIGYEGSQTGFVSPRGMNLEGGVTLKLPVVPDLNGKLIMSTLGFAACTNMTFFQGGFGHHWGDSLPPRLFSGCDLAPFRVNANSSGPHADAAATLRLRRGLPHAAFAATGRSGAPAVTVSGPGGVRLQSPADGSALRSNRALILPAADENTTYVVVNDPRPGAWHVDSTEPLAHVSVANGLPKPTVKARIRRAGGGKMRLTYSVKPLPGQRVRFTERGTGVATALGVARGKRGTITFKPRVASRAARTIEADVIQSGLPRALLTVARFKGPSFPKLRRPVVRATRVKTKLTLSWRAVRGADSYVVEVRQGRQLLHRVLSRRARTRLAGLPARGALRVTVQALSDVVRPGPVARRTVRP